MISIVKAGRVALAIEILSFFVFFSVIMWHHDDDYGRRPSKRPDNLIRQVKHCFLISRFFFGKKLLFCVVDGTESFLIVEIIIAVILI